MNIYQAIMRAADSIEGNPRLFDFDSILLPDHECGTPGCALGWVSLYLGLRRSDNNYEYDPLALGSESKFYRRMNVLCGDSYDWMDNAITCARTLRLYAEKYHGDQKPELPAEILAIFEPGDKAAA